MKIRWLHWLLLSAVTAHAAVSSDDAARLGTSLTPLGAEKGPNASGTIPPWTGGHTSVPPGFKEGGHYPDPFVDDRILFTIDSGNWEKYREQLTQGQIAMLRKYPSWKMPVYATRRSAAFPEAYYRHTAANATQARLVRDGNGIEGAKGGIPFPIPANGLEAIWNHLVRYRGDSFAMSWNQAPVMRDGSYTMVRMENEFDFDYGNLSKDNSGTSGKLFHFLQTVTAPARLAGQILLVHEFVDQVKDARVAWTYNPGQRRVRLAPNVAYDNPGTASDGLRTNDDFLMFNGATDRYDWTLAGKREIYVPYNAYRLNGNTIKYADLIKPLHLEPSVARYELHRMWVVEAKLKTGVSHIYARRTFYVDEDSWNVLLVDKYDGRGNLWRFAELHSINFYNVPMLFPTVEVHYDLQADRYIASGLRNEEPVVYQRITRTPGDFSPSALRGAGTR
jgi:hypothetical protein